jgi:hypothetical protein
MTVRIEPLDTALWFRRIEKIGSGELGDIANSLRHASHLLQLAPLPFRDAVRLAIDEDRFEALLADGEYDAAARHLIAQPAVLTIDTSESGSSARATISCAILNRAISGTGGTVAEAVLSAWTTCLLALEGGANLVSAPLRPGRTGQSERDRRLS